MAKWLGSSVKRKEDLRLLTGKGTFVDDLKPTPQVYYAAVLRSPHPHARIIRLDPTRATQMPGVISVLTGDDVARMSRPFSVGVTQPVKYYPAAVDKVRYVGEPVAVVVAKDRYAAEDALDLIDVEYEVLPAVVDPEVGAQPDAPILHENCGNNIAVQRLLHYGSYEQAKAEADVVISTGRLVFPKYSSVPLEGYAIIANYDPIGDEITVWSNFHGPFILHPIIAKSLGQADERLRFIIPPDIGGGFGIKTSVFPYLALIALAAKKAQCTVKWTEDRLEHLAASSSHTDRVSYLECAAKRDGTILGVKMTIYDNVGGYIRAPEPACLYRPTGNYVGPYKFQNLLMDTYGVMTNKSPTGPNRGYGCQQLYFGLERLVDKLAIELNLDPAELRRKNYVEPDKFPYTTPSGGIYDSGNYPAVLDLALKMSDYQNLRKQQEEARKAGRLFGIGIASVVDPTVSNMGYVTVALPYEVRSRPDYLEKSGATETGFVKIDPLGGVRVAVNTLPEGQGHETAAAQIVSEILGVRPEDVRVDSSFDTADRVWSIATGSYSSRFASAGASAVANGAKKVREKMMRIAAEVLEARPEDLDAANGRIFVLGSPDRSISIKHVAGIAHWNPKALPEGMEPGLNATTVFNFERAVPPDEKDRVNSSNTYGFITEIVAVEVERETGEVKIVKYVTCHDAGRILNPMIVEGQIHGALVHGLAGALYEEMAYDENGQFLTSTFMDYLCPTACEIPEIEIGHVETPSPFSVLGSKGCGESSTMSAPAAIANAVADALRPLGLDITSLPLGPSKVWTMLTNPSKR